MNRSRVAVLLAAASFCAGVPALAGPPSLIMTGQIWEGMSDDGNTVVGSIHDATLHEQVVYSYTFGVGPLRSDAVQDGSPCVASGDGSIVIFTAYDLENVAGFGTDRMTSHLWRPALGTVTNLGKPPWGSNCDAFTSTIWDISGDGHYGAASGYTASLCGPYRAQRYNIQTNTWEILPLSTSPPPLNVPASATRADKINGDGTVIIGYDQNYDSTFTQNWRGSAAWVWNGSAWVQTILDRYYNGAKAVSADGNTIVGYMSTQKMQSTFGTSTQYPIRWTRSGTTWTPHLMGGSGGMVPVAVSADGSTIVGSGGSAGGWIWHTGDANPTSLASYVASLGGSFPGISFAAGVGSPIYYVSNDGKRLLVSTQISDCLTWFPSAILDLDGAPCEPANIILSAPSHYNPDGPIDEPGGMVFNVHAAGSWPMTFQWQKETGTGTGVWDNLSDDNCAEYIPDYFNYRGTHGMQLRLGGLDNIWSGRYRCVVSNSCGSQTSGVIRAATCYADFDCNGFVNGDDFDSFVALFELGDPESDIDGNTFVNGDDFDTFVLAFEAGC